MTTNNTLTTSADNRTGRRFATNCFTKGLEGQRNCLMGKGLEEQKDRGEKREVLNGEELEDGVTNHPQ